MHLLTSKWTVVLVSLFVLIISQAHATPIKAPSNNGGFWNTSMRLCDVDAEGKCHTKDYALSIVKYGSGGVAVAGLCLLALICFLPGRFLCNGFGGKQPSYGFCPSDEKRYYRRKEIISVKIATALLIIPIVIAVGIGFQANSEISNSISNITTELVQSGDEILLSLQQTQTIVQTFSNDPNVLTTLASAVSTAEDVDKNLRDARDTVDKYDKVREALMIVGFALAILMVVAGIVCAIFNLRIVAMILGIFGLMGLVIVWLSFGVHLVAGKFVYDTCVDIDILTSNNTAQVSGTTSLLKTGALAKLWACDNNTNLANLEAVIDESITQAANSACQLRSAICYNATAQTGDPNWLCSSTPQCNRNTLQTVTDFQHMQILDGGQEKSVNQCAINCVNSNYKNISTVITNSLSLYQNYTNIYYGTILPILNCQLAEQVLLEIKDPLCDSIFNSLYGVAVTCLIVGIFFIPFVILMIVGYKRFQSLEGGIV